jgi:hypothetical protein
MQDKIINYIENNFEKPLTLILGYLLIILTVVSIDTFLSGLICNIYYRSLIYLGLLAIWTIIWSLKRNWLPKNSKGKLGIIISINTENDRQKTLLNNDFVKQLNDLIYKNNLHSLINVLNLNPRQSIKISSMLVDYTKTCETYPETKFNNPIIKKFFKTRDKINGHFYIWGNIKERKDGDNKYFIELYGLVVHNPLDINTKSFFQTEVINSWIKNIEFKENVEFKGFLFSANMTFIAIEYITGLAALFSGDLNIAERLHTNLEKNICQLVNPTPNIKHINSKLKALITEEYILLARAYLKTNLQLSEKYLSIVFQRKPDSYEGYLLKSIIEFSNYSNPKAALESVRKAQKYANVDNTWRYNEGFLLMNLEDFENAYRTYKKISEVSYPAENYTLNEIIAFNENYVKANPSYCQSYFILGYLHYKKKQNYPAALLNFEEFIKYSSHSKYEFLNKRVNTYIAELNLRMGLK